MFNIVQAHLHCTAADYYLDRAMLATNPTFDVGFLTDAIEETSHIRFDIPAPDIEQDAMGDDDAEGEIDDEIQKD